MPSPDRPGEDHASAMPVAALVAAAVLWSSGGLLIKFVSWNPLAISGARSAIAAVLLFAFIRRPRFTLSVPQIGGALCYASAVMLFVAATKLTTAANAILLQYTAPVYTALFSGPFLKEKISGYDWAAVGVVLGGTVLFFLDQLSVGGYLGNGLALVSGVAIAWLGLFLRKQKEGSNMESLLLGNMIAAAVGFFFMFSGSPSWVDWAALGVLGLLQIGLSYILYAWAMKRVRALDAMLIITIEPVLNPVWVFLFIGERPGPWALAGGVVVVITVLLRSVHRGNHRRRLFVKPAGE
jgi:drug/metabolite transporter (DMT)-like permease